MYSTLQVVKMLATVVILFALCWLPIQMFNMLHWFRVEFIDTTTDAGFHLYNGLFFCCHWLAVSSFQRKRKASLLLLPGPREQDQLKVTAARAAETGIVKLARVVWGIAV